MFTQGEGGWVNNQKCFWCGNKGYIATNCPAEKPSTKNGNHDADSMEQMHMMHAVESDSGDDDELGGKLAEVDRGDDACYFFHQRDTQGLSWDWLLLDSQGSTDMFYNREYLRDSRVADRLTTIQGNARSMVCEKEGVFAMD